MSSRKRRSSSGGSARRTKERVTCEVNMTQQQLEDLIHLCKSKEVREGNTLSVEAKIREAGFLRLPASMRKVRDAVIEACVSKKQSEERVIKLWPLVKINAYNREDERLFLLTSAAYYTCCWDAKKQSVEKVKRHELINYGGVVTGTLTSKFYSLSGQLHKALLDGGSYGMRLLWGSAVEQSSVTKRIMGSLNKKDKYEYSRMFRAPSDLDDAQGTFVILEVAWVVYAFAEALLGGSADPPREEALYRPSVPGSGMYALAYNKLKLGQPSAKASAEDKGRSKLDKRVLEGAFDSLPAAVGETVVLSRQHAVSVVASGDVDLQALTVKDSESLQQLFCVYRQAAQNRDLDQLKQFKPSEMHPALDSMAKNGQLAMVWMFLNDPPLEEIEFIQERKTGPNTGVLEMRTNKKISSHAQEGTADFVRVGTQWKVREEEWNDVG